MYREKTVMVQGVPTSYRVHGGQNHIDNNKVLLLLHGWGSNKESFSAIQSELGNSISVDMPGFGKTPLVSTQWGVEEYAYFVKDFCKAIGVVRILDIVGHSFGGRVAVAISASGDSIVDQITLVGTPIYRDESRRAGVLVRLARWSRRLPMMEQIRDRYYRQYLGLADYVDSEKSGLSEIFKKTITYCVDDHAQEISVPVRLLWGAQDDTVPIAHAEKIAQERGYVLQTVSGGHFPFVDSPKEFLGAYQTLG